MRNFIRLLLFHKLFLTFPQIDFVCLFDGSIFANYKLHMPALKFKHSTNVKSEYIGYDLSVIISTLFSNPMNEKEKNTCCFYES